MPADSAAAQQHISEMNCKAISPNAWSTSPCPTAARVGGCKSTGANAANQSPYADCYIDWLYNPPNQGPYPAYLCPADAGYTVLP